MTGAVQTGTIELRVAGARVLFTSREEGNLSTLAGREPDRDTARRAALAARLSVTRLCAGPQVHGTTIDVIESDGPAGAAPLVTAADARMTSVPGVAVMVLSADCVPVALACGQAVAAVHAGWRGLADGVLESAVAQLREAGGGGQVSAAIGPCAASCCYEVGPEVLEALDLPGGGARTVELAALAEQRLRAAGVTDIEVAGRCTICDERYFSHRREGRDAGRQGVLVWRA